MSHNSLTPIRAQFPQLNVKIKNNDLVYLDSAATTLKPQSVIDRLVQFYSFENANIHRGAHFQSQAATSEYEGVRTKVAQFLHAETEEIVFTSGTTEGLNLLAASFGEVIVSEGDEILITELEHHANIIPWQELARRKNGILRVVRVTDSGEIDLDDLELKLNSRTKIFSFSACSNTIGTVTPVQFLISKAKKVGAATIVDAAQWVSRESIDVQKLGCDFLVFSAHKLFGPTGVGVLFGKKEHLDKMPPYQTGGSMISEVTFQKTTFNKPPYKFEAGTPHIAGVIGFGTALDFFRQIPENDLIAHEDHLMQKLKTCLAQFDGLKILGSPAKQGPLLSFNIEGVHHSDLAQLLDEQGIAVRAGHLCTQPLLERFGLAGTVRVAFSVYSNENDVVRFDQALHKAIKMLR